MHSVNFTWMRYCLEFTLGKESSYRDSAASKFLSLADAEKIIEEAEIEINNNPGTFTENPGYYKDRLDG